MKKTAVLFALLLLSSQAFAKSIDITDAEVWQGDEAPVEIIVDDPSGIAGAAFTISYDSTNLDLLKIEISESFFDLMVMNPDVESGTAIAAGRPLPHEGSTPQPMFNLSFGLKPGANPGQYPISIIPTIINDEGNGYPPEGAPVDPLIGAKLNVDLDEAFPVLLSADETDKLGSSTINFKPSPQDGDYTFSLEAGYFNWVDVITVPDGWKANITDIFFLLADKLRLSDYGGVYLRWAGEDKHFAFLWFIYRSGYHESMNLHISPGKTLQARVWKKSSFKNKPSTLTFSVKWEKID